MKAALALLVPPEIHNPVRKLAWDIHQKYHTGIDMKAVTPPEPKPTHGKYANNPIRVADNLAAICAALGEPNVV